MKDFILKTGTPLKLAGGQTFEITEIEVEVVGTTTTTFITVGTLTLELNDLLKKIDEGILTVAG